MEQFRAVFQIVEDNNCPLYELDDFFVLTEKSICFPDGKESCLILVREMTQLLFQLMEVGGADYEKTYACSGCTGLIKFRRVQGDDITLGSESEALLSEKEQKLFDKISNYSLLRAIPPNHLKKFISSFKGKLLKKDEFVITKGELNEHLFIIVSGEVVVEDGSIPITRLGEGEIFGEMSYFGDSIPSTSVRCLKEARVLAIHGKDFGKLIRKTNPVQAHMAKLLAERLSRANSIRAKDFESCMQGRVNEMAPAELLQVFHMHQKTGKLTLDLPHGIGYISFLEGAIISAEYNKQTGQNAVFGILRERDGIYNFTTGLSESEMGETAIGDFMMLLMEGVKRVDED